MMLNNSRNNDIKVLAFAVAWAPRTVGLGGKLESDLASAGGRMSNLSGKPTIYNMKSEVAIPARFGMYDD